MPRHLVAYVLLFSVMLLVCTTATTSHAITRIVDYRVMASHNSYKIAPHPEVHSLIRQVSPYWADALAYTHPPLHQQLDEFGVRHFEFDVYADPEGGRYRYRLADDLLGNDPWHPEPTWAQPGFKVFHLPDFDYRSHCPSLHACLTALVEWSNAHPNHLLITVQLELISRLVGDQHDFSVKPVPYTPALVEALEQEVRAAVPAHKRVSPDHVRGSYADLRTAVLARRWPSLAEGRGKLLIALDDTTKARDWYLDGHPSLEERAMFVTVPEDHRAAAYFVLNDPLAEQEHIRSLVAKGYLVRTRADADTWEARRNDRSRFAAALSSNAQFISSDYLEVFPATGYKISLPGGGLAECLLLQQARSNCQAADLHE